MKKVLAMVLALILALSLSAVAFATASTDESPASTIDGSIVEDVVNDKDNIKIDLGKAEGTDDETDVVPDKPGATYMFALLNKDGDTAFDKDDYVQHLTVSIKESGDKMIKAYSIVKEKGVWYVKVTTEVSYDTAKKVADWTITLKRKALTVATATVEEVTQKWAVIDGNDAEDKTDVTDAEAEVVAVMSDNELGSLYVAGVTKSKNSTALLTMAKTNKVTEIQFDESDVWYTAQNSSKTTVNVYFDEEDDTFSKFFDEADLYTIMFKGKPSFSRTGTLHATVAEDMFVYAVKDGKLVESFKWNKTAKCWEMDTRVLEGVVVSDEKLDIAAYNKGVTSTDKDNPGTGSVDFVNVAVALGVVSLAAAGAVALKK